MSDYDETLNTATYDGIAYDGTNSDEFAKTGFSGQSRRGEWWYLCDVCGTCVPGSRTTTVAKTYAQEGLRMCFQCVDEPGVDDARERGAAILERALQGEAISRAKPD